MSPLEITLLVLVSLLLLVWIAITAAVLILVWRVGKVVLGFTIAVKGVTELVNQVSDAGKRAGRFARRSNKGRM